MYFSIHYQSTGLLVDGRGYVVFIHLIYRLVEDIYQTSDVEHIADCLKNVIKENIRQELSNYMNMATLIMRQLLMEAESQGCDLVIDVAKVEDRGTLIQTNLLIYGLFRMQHVYLDIDDQPNNTIIDFCM